MEKVAVDCRACACLPVSPTRFVACALRQRLWCFALWCCRAKARPCGTRDSFVEAAQSWCAYGSSARASFLAPDCNDGRVFRIASGNQHAELCMCLFTCYNLALPLLLSSHPLRRPTQLPVLPCHAAAKAALTQSSLLTLCTTPQPL